MNLNRILRKNQQIVVYSSDSDSDVDIRHVVTRRQWKDLRQDEKDAFQFWANRINSLPSHRQYK